MHIKLFYTYAMDMIIVGNGDYVKKMFALFKTNFNNYFL